MKKILLYVVAHLLTTVLYAGTVTGFFVDGGYSPGKKDTDMDKLIDKRLDEASDIMEKKYPDSKRHKIHHKKELLDALKALQCKCGDVLMITMMGHGRSSGHNPSGFIFTKDEEKITPEELRVALTGAAKECCCKMHVVIFSCHSGSFMEELFKEEHVISVHTSCSATELSYSDASYISGSFTDNGDWMKGFNEDWKADTNKADMAAAMINSSKSAREKMPFPPSGANQTPQGWCRGEYPVLAHVSERTRDAKTKKIIKLKIHFTEPIFLRCKTKEVDVSKVNVPDSIDKCKWVRFIIRTGKPDDKLVAVTDVAATSPPVEHILAHVEARNGNTLTLRIISPKWLYGRIVTVPFTAGVDAKIQPCNWTEVNLTINNPDDDKRGFSSSDVPKAQDQDFRCKVHIEKVGKEKGIIELHILEPPWLRCQNKTETVPENEREKMKFLDKCSNIMLTMTFHPDGTENIKKLQSVTSSESSYRYPKDMSVQNAHIPEIEVEATHYTPSMGVTNTGTMPASAAVYGVICPLSKKAAIDQWWRTGKGEPSGEGVWWNVQSVANLEFAQTRVLTFSDWTVPQVRDSFWIGFRVVLNGDQNNANDTASVAWLLDNPPNTPPLVQSAMVQPQSGNTQMPYTYSIQYMDADGDAPAIAQVIIDGVPHQLQASSNHWREGVQFTFRTNLPRGQHQYSFVFDDAHGNRINTPPQMGPVVQ